jgi:hypothetical protein
MRSRGKGALVVGAALGRVVLVQGRSSAWAAPPSNFFPRCGNAGERTTGGMGAVFGDGSVLAARVEVIEFIVRCQVSGKNPPGTIQFPAISMMNEMDDKGTKEAK